MSAILTREDRALLTPYVTTLDGPVYALRGLPEEVVAVLFAYYSRSRESLRDNLLKLIRDGDLHLAEAASDEPAAADFLARAAEKARAFHEKWVVGYGHASVAEHAVVHLAIEDVSILASKAIEEARLASYTEKSTRYVRFDTSRVVVPDVFAAGPAATTFRAGLEPLLATYDALMEPLTGHFLATRPRREGQSEKGHRTACQAQACDVLRYLLPAATPTNLGLTANARTLEALLAKLLSHPLAEVRQVAARMKEEAQKIVPTLIKYAAASEYRAATDGAMAAQAAALLGGAPAATAAPTDTAAPPLARLVRWNADAELRVVEAILAGATAASGEAVAAAARALSDEQRRRLLDDYVSRRGRFDPPLRALEATHVTFEIVVDYGAWRDLQRHRLLTIVEQRLGCDLGYETPPALEEAGLAGPYHAAMTAARAAWSPLAAEHPEEAAYVVPLAFRKRAFVSMNLREAHHLIPLRSSRQGHPSYRRVAQAMHAELARVLPALAAAIRVDTADYDLSRA
jgi:thymidylate synthase ThyX